MTHTATASEERLARYALANTLVDYVIWCGNRPDASALDIAQYARELLTDIFAVDENLIARMEADIASAKRQIKGDR